MTEPVTEPEIQQDIPQENTEDTQQNEPVEPEYYSPDGASQMTLDLLDYVNPLREKYGLKPLRASGQLDECLQKSLYQMDDYCQALATYTNISLRLVCLTTAKYDNSQQTTAVFQTMTRHTQSFLLG